LSSGTSLGALDVGLKPDWAGWVGVTEVLAAANRHGIGLTLEQLKQVVDNDKKRFAFSEDKQRLRASQGHSVEVDLQNEPTVPPEFLYHCTPERFVDSIRYGGLNKGQRHHVHLSPDAEIATKVGLRRGRPVVLRVRLGETHRQGDAFFRSANGAWLVERGAPRYLEILS
jgi:putative RNA 2'-phosphotransferase